jgi:FtsZ-interacting cell division protein ZipA
LRGLLESAGFSLSPDGRFWLRADDGSALVSAADLGEQPLTLERLRSETINGISFAVDVPRVPANARAVERMLEAARQLAHAFDVEVVDDNRAPLTEAGIKIIREQVKSVQAAMLARNIPAGSALALRLFS